MWPGGDKERQYPLAEIRIANVSNLADISNYKYGIVRKSRGKNSRSLPTRTGEVKGFPRKRLNVLDLVYRVLRDEVGERNEPKRSRKPKTINGVATFKDGTPDLGVSGLARLLERKEGKR